MVSVDTNILARIFIADKNDKQTSIAQNFIREVKKVFVAQSVQIELTWVLGNLKKKETGEKIFKKEDIIRTLEHLGNNTAFELQNPAAFSMALEWYRDKSNTEVKFSDCIIWAEAFAANHLPLVTFDVSFSELVNKGSKLTHIKLLK